MLYGLRAEWVLAVLGLLKIKVYMRNSQLRERAYYTYINDGI
jgi:hypothetical protein